MFDRIMEHSMAIWLLVSLTYPIFFFGTILKALWHWRRLRDRSAYAPAAPSGIQRETVQSEDWVATR
jgi:hypothetical protein